MYSIRCVWYNRPLHSLPPPPPLLRSLSDASTALVASLSPSAGFDHHYRRSHQGPSAKNRETNSPVPFSLSSPSPTRVFGPRRPRVPGRNYMSRCLGFLYPLNDPWR